MAWPTAADREHRAAVPSPSPEIDNSALRGLNPITDEQIQETIAEARVRHLVRCITSEAQLQELLDQVEPSLRTACERLWRPMLIFPGADTSIEGL